MTRTDIAESISKKTGITKKLALEVTAAFTETVSEALVKGDKVQLVGFGTFEVTKRAAKEGRNPKTGEKIKIAASKTPKFKAGKALKDSVNKKK